MSDLEIAILAGLGGMLGWGLADFFAKKTIDEIGDMQSLVWAHVAGTTILGAIVAERWSTGSNTMPGASWSVWLGLGIFGVAQGLIYILVYRGFGKGQVSVLNPIFSSYSGVAAALSVLLFGEAFNAGRLAVLGVAFAGVVLLSLQPESAAPGAPRLGRVIGWGRAPGVREVSLAAAMAAVWTVAWGHFVGDRDWLPYAFLMYAAMTMAIIAIAKFQGVPLAVRRSSIWTFVALIGATEVIAYVSISVGFGKSSLTSVVAVLSGAFALPTILLARTFLNERLTRKQAIGAALVVGSVAAMALL